MRYIILILAWITPAFIAGVLGWRGIWGNNNVVIDYLIPIPVAGGVLHVPSFALAAIIILTVHKWPKSLADYFPLSAFVTVIAAQTLQLRFNILFDWLYTDSQTFPIKFNDNPLLLFVSFDALWVALYTKLKGYGVKAEYWLLVPLTPVFIILVVAVVSPNPTEKIRIMRGHAQNGNELHLVYNTKPYDEQAYLAWFERQTMIKRPEFDHSQHLGVYFMNSLNEFKKRRTDNAKTIVATLCAYEEDQSVKIYQGYFDCFSKRKNFSEKMAESAAKTKTGLGYRYDKWFSAARLCENIPETQNRLHNITRLKSCEGFKYRYSKDVQSMIERFGADSKQVESMQAFAKSIGWD